MDYRSLICGSGGFRGWVVFVLFAPLIPFLLTPYSIVLLFCLPIFVIPPVYFVAGLTEWVFRRVIVNGRVRQLQWDGILRRVFLASIWAPLLFGTLVFVPWALIFVAPMDGMETALIAAAVITAAIAFASVFVMIFRERAIVDDILENG